jgi:hypothetical protein
MTSQFGLSTKYVAVIREVTDTQTDTHIQNDYRNLRCACAPRVIILILYTKFHGT